jgi:hypothetical protein
MVISTIMGTLVGILLGLRFRVFSIVPAILVAAVVVVVNGAARGDRLNWLALAVVVVGASLQVGYLAGSSLRAIVSAACGGNANLPASRASKFHKANSKRPLVPDTRTESALTKVSVVTQENRSKPLSAAADRYRQQSEAAEQGAR